MTGTPKLAPGRGGTAETTFFQQAEVAEALDLLSTGPITVIVGAGASAEVGFPTWSELLRRTFDGLMQLPHMAGYNKDVLRAQIYGESDPLAQADLLEQLSRTSNDEFYGNGGRKRTAFLDLLEHALYAQVDPWTRPGPTARAVARLYETLNPTNEDGAEAQCHLATTNFDVMLEIALREQVRRAHPELRGKSLQEYLRRNVVSYMGGELQDPDLERSDGLAGPARVRHLHGAVPGKHHQAYHHAGLANRVIITGTDFLSDRDPWFENFLRERMRTDHLLFVGASLADQHLLRSLLHGMKGNREKQATVALIPRSKRTGDEVDIWRGHSDASIQLEASRRHLWRDADKYDTIALFPDWYVQVGQFVEELIQRRIGGSRAIPYEQRLEEWFEWFVDKRLTLDGRRGTDVSGFRRQQVRLNRIARGWVSQPESDDTTPDSEEGPPLGVVEYIAQVAGEDDVGKWTTETGECIVVHLWTRVPYHSDPSFRRHRELALTVCSDRIWQHPLAVDMRRITYPTRRTAIEAFMSGYTKIRNTAGRDHQWNFVAAVPVRLPEVRGQRAPLTVGVLCIQSNLPWTYAESDSLYGGAKLTTRDRRMAPYERVDGELAPVTTMRLAHEHWLRRKTPGHAPLDVILAGLAQSAQRLVLIPPGYRQRKKST